MTKQVSMLGLDMGTFAIKGVLVDGERITRVTVPTAGQPVIGARQCLQQLLADYQGDRVRLGVTGANASVIHERWSVKPVIDIEALSKGIAAAGLKAEAVLSLGHENMYYLELESDQKLSFFNRNGQCAAGSGAFWYQQATRMGYSAEELSQLAVSAESAARISGRCAVFAKSDMTHAINEGATQKAVSAGLARVLAEMIVNSITQNRIFSAHTVLAVGGVANNQAVIRFLNELCADHPVRIHVPEHHEYFTALGAAQSGEWVEVNALRQDEQERRTFVPEEPLPPLSAERVTYLPRVQPPAEAIDASVIYVGVDCGSVSTKCVLLDRQGRLLGGVYLPTSGRPVLQVLELMKRIREEYGDQLGEARMVGCTTGSGRFLSQRVLNAEYALDEITCQAEGVAQLCGEEGTLSIIEIGGEDSKFLSLQDGVLSDYNMNPVCAAGTGTFLENLAGILGVNIKEEFSELAFQGEYAVDLGDRCTLLSQSALAEAASQGLPLPSQLASLAYASARNYLSKTTENRPLEGKVVFTGATAQNHALAAAFAQELDTQILVPPMPELTGALGSAIMARKLHESGEPGVYTMRSLEHLNEYTQTQRKCSARCEHGHNCTLDVMTFSDGTSFLYGDRCGRFSEIEKSRSGSEFDMPDYVAIRNALCEDAAPSPAGGGPRVGIARAGNFFDLYPFWAAFFRELGAEPIVTAPSSGSTLDEGKACLDAEMCYPVEVLVGHYQELSQCSLDFIFLPEVVDMPGLPWAQAWPRNFTCPLLQTIRGTVLSSLDLDEDKILYAELRYRTADRRVMEEQWRPVAERVLGKRFDQKILTKAVEAGYQALEKFHQSLEQASIEMFKVLEETDAMTTVAVFLGRPYTIYDDEVSKRSLTYARQRGMLAIPQEFLLSYVQAWYAGRTESSVLGSKEEFNTEFQQFFDRMDHIYPAQLQRMLSTAFLVDYINRRADRHDLPMLHTVLQDPFRCGPNAMLRHYLSTISNSLRLTMDEHTAPAGMITRLEAFRNTCRGRHRYFPPVSWSSRSISMGELSGRKLLIPSVIPQSQIFAAVFQNFGVDAQVLPRSTDYDFTLARRYVNGEECLPLIQNVQDFLEYVNNTEDNIDDVAFFQGWACGPCRYGMYAPTQSLILDRAGCGPGSICSIRLEDTIRQFGLSFAVAAYDGMLAADVLQKLLLASRPYEKQAGASQQLFDESIAQLTDLLSRFRPSLSAILRGAHLRPIVELLQGAARRFAQLPRHQEKRPKIMVAGEFYVRLDERSNQDVISKVEAAGGEASLSPASELMAYSTIIMYQEAARAFRSEAKFGHWLIRSGVGTMNWLARRDEMRIEHATDGIFAVDHEPHPQDVQRLSLPYVSSHYGGEPPMTIGRTCAMVGRGIIDGVIFVAPFGCMPGAVVEAQVNTLRERLGVPFVNLYYDGQKSANTDEFIAGLVFQARQRVIDSA